MQKFYKNFQNTIILLDSLKKIILNTHKLFDLFKVFKKPKRLFEGDFEN